MSKKDDDKLLAELKAAMEAEDADIAAATERSERAVREANEKEQG